MHCSHVPPSPRLSRLPHPTRSPAHPALVCSSRRDSGSGHNLLLRTVSKPPIRPRSTHATRAGKGAYCLFPCLTSPLRPQPFPGPAGAYASNQDDHRQHTQPFPGPAGAYTSNQDHMILMPAPITHPYGEYGPSHPAHIPPPPFDVKRESPDHAAYPLSHHQVEHQNFSSSLNVETYLRQQDYLRGLPPTLPVHLNSLQNGRDPTERPPYTMMQLASVAIASHPRQRASSAEIRDMLTERFPYFEGTKEQKELGVSFSSQNTFTICHLLTSLQETLKHALSSYCLFKRVPRTATEPGRGGLWELDVITNPGGKRTRRGGSSEGASPYNRPVSPAGSDNSDMSMYSSEYRPATRRGQRADSASGLRRSRRLQDPSSSSAR